MPYAYIVECADGSFYVGSTWDLERRIFEHNEGVGAAYTRRRRRRPVRLVWAGEFERIDEALSMEKRIQGWSRAKATVAHRRPDGGAQCPLEPQLGRDPGTQAPVSPVS